LGQVRRWQNSGHHKNCIKTHEAKWMLEFCQQVKL
jgi:hypothetical protein